MKKLFNLLIISTVILLTFFGCSKSNNTPPKTVTDTVTKTVVDSVFGDTTNRHINDSLWAYFPIDGSTVDSSGHGHILTLGGSAVLSYDLWGNANGAIDLNSTDQSDYALIPDGSTFTSDSFSVSEFIMPRTESGLIFARVNYTTGEGASWYVGADPTLNPDLLKFAVIEGQAGICSGTGFGDYLAITSSMWVTSSWYHVVATYNEGTQKLYVNGALIDSVVVANDIINNCSDAQFVLGNWWSGDNRQYFNGRIDDIRIYNRVLKPNEVSYLFDNYKH